MYLSFTDKWYYVDSIFAHDRRGLSIPTQNNYSSPQQLSHVILTFVKPHLYPTWKLRTFQHM
jgi:hypothetical protein